MANQAIKKKTLGELLQSLRQNTLYERNGQHRYFVAAVGNEIGVMEENHNRLKTRIAPTLADSNHYDFANVITSNAHAGTGVNPVGSLTWDQLIAGAGVGLVPGNSADAVHFTINEITLNDYGGARQRAVDVINGDADARSPLPPSAAAAGTVSNNHIIARIRQEIAAGANDARILELIGVMQNPRGHANPNGNQANEILYAIKRNLGGALNDTIITPIINQLDEKIAVLKQLHNSAAKRDVAALEQIKKEVTSAKFKDGLPGALPNRPNHRNFVDDISKFKKSLDTLASVHTKMARYNAPVVNINDAVGAIQLYDNLLRNSNSTEQDIEEAYINACNQCTQNTRLESYLEELDESRDNYFKQLDVYNKFQNLQESALEVAPLHPKKNLAISIGSAVVGATITGAVTYWLHTAFSDTIPGTPAVPASIITKSDGSLVDKGGTPATDATTEAPNGSEAVLIAVVCIAMLAITAYIAYHYYSRYKEDKDLDPSLNKILLNIDGIAMDKSRSQIQKERNEVAVVDYNIKKIAQNPVQRSLIQAF